MRNKHLDLHQRIVNAAHAILCSNESFSGLGRIISVFRFRRKCKPCELPLGQIKPLTQLRKSFYTVFLLKPRSELIPFGIALGENTGL